MKRYAILIAFAAAAAKAQSLAPPQAPSALQPPAGNELYLKGQAEGTQNYICLPTATGYAWTFFSPQATLYYTVRWFGGDLKQQITTHFLSPNPEENLTPRPTWQGSIDSSAVWARAQQSSNDPAFVQPGAIPWLLLVRAGSRPGPTGGAFLSNTTYIQRVHTEGGVAPAQGCTSSANVGDTALVPYKADYYFYRKAS